jgi:hypothetical protein
MSYTAMGAARIGARGAVAPPKYLGPPPRRPARVVASSAPVRKYRPPPPHPGPPPPGIVPSAASGYGECGDDVNISVLLWSALSTASMAASAYHGYKRNDSVGWALGWGFLGAVFPVITPTIAVAQGFGKRKSGR